MHGQRPGARDRSYGWLGGGADGAGGRYLTIVNSSVWGAEAPAALEASRVTA